MKQLIVSAILLLLGFSSAIAADVPEAGENDPRVRYSDYKKDGVTYVPVRRGVVTRIVLAEDEAIELGATGFSADCAKDALEWCVVADKGTNQIWVKPKDGATVNNLELKSNRRDYSFEFKVLPDAPNGRTGKSLSNEPFFRVIVRYPMALPPLDPMLATPAQRSLSPAEEMARLNEQLTSAKPVPVNWNYTMQALKGSEEIAPAMVFDDGRFTYFQFPANREMPSIYTLSPTHEEARVNFTMEGDLAVVQRMGRHFVLRLGEAAVGVWNEAFDADGVPTPTGVTVPGFIRTVR